MNSNDAKKVLIGIAVICVIVMVIGKVSPLVNAKSLTATQKAPVETATNPLSNDVGSALKQLHDNSAVDFPKLDTLFSQNVSETKPKSGDIVVVDLADRRLIRTADGFAGGMASIPESSKPTTLYTYTEDNGELVINIPSEPWKIKCSDVDGWQTTITETKADVEALCKT